MFRRLCIIVIFIILFFFVHTLNQVWLQIPQKLKKKDTIPLTRYNSKTTPFYSTHGIRNFPLNHATLILSTSSPIIIVGQRTLKLGRSVCSSRRSWANALVARYTPRVSSRRRSAAAAASPSTTYIPDLAIHGTHEDSPMYPGSRTGVPASSSSSSSSSSESPEESPDAGACRYRASGASSSSSLIRSTTAAGARSTTGRPRRSSRHRPRMWSARMLSTRIWIRTSISWDRCSPYTLRLCTTSATAARIRPRGEIFLHIELFEVILFVISSVSGELWNCIL